LLLQISIKNFAIFKDVTLEPGENYNVITGESGAGKSVIVNAMSLICGARAFREMIRTGEKSASVEAVFRIPAYKKEIIYNKLNLDDELLVITRIIHKDKPSVCKINGKIRNLSQITEVASNFIDIHGQYENQALLNIDNHIKYLDDFAKDKLLDCKIEYRKLLNEYNTLINSIVSVSGGEAERERNKQILEFQIDEIDSAGIDSINENALIERKILLENAENYQNASGTALNMLENEESSVTESLRSAAKELEALPDNEKIKKITRDINEAYFLLQETAVEISRFKENIEFNEDEYEDLLDKLEKIRDLKRKYGDSISDIIKFRDNAAMQLNKIKDFKQFYSRNLGRLSELEKIIKETDFELTAIRMKASDKLKMLIISELEDMGMNDSVILVKFDKNYFKNILGFIEFKKDGNDICEFMISLNKGLEPVTLGKVASGGEMSRIMLALKTVFSYKDDTETVVFDEIDSGLSGEASIAVANKLKDLSNDKQIICITHLPQIAAKAEGHFVIKKDSQKEITFATVKKVSSMNERINVIASLTDGENITTEGREHAIKIVKESNKLFN